MNVSFSYVAVAKEFWFQARLFIKLPQGMQQVVDPIGRVHAVNALQISEGADYGQCVFFKDEEVVSLRYR